MFKIILVLIFLSIYPINSLYSRTIEQNLPNIIKILKKHHFRTLKIDKKLNSEITNDFLDNLDPERIIFLNKDIKNIKRIKLDLNHYSKQDSLSLYFKVKSLYKKRLLESKLLIQQAAHKPFNYRLEETILFNSDTNPDYPKDNKEKKDILRKMFKYKILYKYISKRYHAKKSFKNFKAFLKAEKKIRAKTKKREIRKIDSILNHIDGYNKFISSVFINTLLSKYDPHTMYFSYEEKKRFEKSLSKKAYSYGLYFKKNLIGETQIDRLIPGGPAWKSSMLNKNDIVLEISYPAKSDKKYNCSELRIVEVEKILNNPRHKQIILKVKKKNGLIKKVKLFKKILSNEDNMINSFILNGSQKIGYICLPAFYAEFEGENGGCANDIAKEIYKLQKEKITGLILDLRDNGGGAIIEALDLIGLFIDEGPICIMKSRQGRPITIRDRNRGTVYDGPLIVLVNEQTASASEYFASAMKDYNRALIVGNTTFGKASSQYIVPIIKNLKKYNTNKRSRNIDFLKITTNLYYNLKGHTHQTRGLKPDIKLPELLNSYNYKEKDLESNIPNLSINKKINYKKLPSILTEDLSEDSEDRVSENIAFKKLRKLNKNIEKLMFSRQEISLEFDKITNKIKSDFDSLSKFENIFKNKSSTYKIINNSDDAELIKIDSYRKKLNHQLIEGIYKDIYVEEAYHIMHDYIKQLNQ